MAITVSVTGDSPEQLQGHLLWLAQRLGAIEVIKEAVTDKVARKVVEEATTAVVEAVKAATTADKAVKAAKKKADSLVDPAEVTVTIPADPPVKDPEPVADALEEAQIRVKIQQVAAAVNNKHGTKSANKVIDKYGYKFSKDVPAELLPKLLADLEAAL